MVTTSNKKPKQIYVGRKFNGEGQEVFTSEKDVTELTKSTKYEAVIGPFKTGLGAKIMAQYGGEKAEIHTIAEAERIAKIAKELCDDLSQK